MTTATLSFAAPGWLSLRCPELGLDDKRVLEGELPFAEWSQVYAAHHRQPDVMLALGVRIGRWLDGAEGWLEQLVAGASAPLVLAIETRARRDKVGLAALDAPWELLARVDPAGAHSSSGRWRAVEAVETARGGADRNLIVPPAPAPFAPAGRSAELASAYHLALDPDLLYAPVRRLGPAGVEAPPSAYRLSVVFMAAQPDGVLPALDVDGEEAELRAATGGIGMDLTVDESGTVDGLGETMARVEACDVVHVSCHGLAEPRPVLLFEDVRGGRDDVTADELATGMAGQTPALVFLSACSTAAATSAGRSLAADLCRRGWPAVIGWAAPVADRGAIRFAARLYRYLSRRLALVDVMAHLRYDLQMSEVRDGASGGEWHRARLYLGPAGGGKLVDGTHQRVIRETASGDALLDPALACAERGARFSRRRALQRILAALRHDENVVLIHGGDERERHQLVVRIARRSTELRRVVVTRRFDALAVLSEIGSHVIDGRVQDIVEGHRAAVTAEPARLALALRELLEGPCQRAGQGAMLLVLLGIDGILEPPTPSDPVARPDAAHHATIVKLLEAFRGARTESRLIVTSALPFAAADADGDDLIASTLREALA